MNEKRALEHRFNAAHNAARRDVFEKVPVSTVPNGCCNILVIVESRQDEYSRSGSERFDKTRTFNSIASGHAHIHEYDIYAVSGSKFIRFLAILARTGNRKIGI
ncbi:hypothetical protein D3C84_875380 [compost metagenome]